jgi:hypothetical protein
MEVRNLLDEPSIPAEDIDFRKEHKVCQICFGGSLFECAGKKNPDKSHEICGKVWHEKGFGMVKFNYPSGPFLLFHALAGNEAPKDPSKCERWWLEGCQWALEDPDFQKHAERFVPVWRFVCDAEQQETAQEE